MGNWWDLYRAVLPADADLVTSRDTPDRFRGFFRGEGGIEGHAEFSKVDGRKLVLISVAAGIALGVLGSVVVVKNRERIKRWWEDQVLTTAQSSWNRITRRQEGTSQSATVEVTVLNRPAHDNFSREIDVAIDDTRTRMSTSEAQRYLLAVLLAASFIAEAMRKLSNARIEGGLPELNRRDEEAHDSAAHRRHQPDARDKPYPARRQDIGSLHEDLRRRPGRRRRVRPTAGRTPQGSAEPAGP